MKNLTLMIMTLALVLAFTKAGHSQEIKAHAIYPDTPTTLDSVYVLIDFKFLNTPCELLNHSVAVSSDTFYLNTCHYEAVFPTICNNTDTFFLGVNIPAGTYHLKTIAKNTGSMVDPNCNVANTSSDTAYWSFQIVNLAGIDDDFNDGLTVRTVNSGRQLILRSTSFVSGQLELYDFSGKKVVRKEIVIDANSSIDIDLPQLSQGLYVYTLKSLDGRNFYGKVRFQ